MAGNRTHSKIERLPETLRRQIEQLLLDGYTYERISQHLKSLGHDISRTAAHRFGSKFLKKFESVRMAKEYAQLLAEDSPDRPSTELHEANNALISEIIMEILMDEDMEPLDKIGAAKAISELQKAQVQNERAKIASRKELGAVKTAMTMLKSKVFDEIQTKHPDIAAAIIRIADEVEAAQGVPERNPART